MKTTILYKTNGAGELVEKIEVKGGMRYAAPSYDSQIDMPMHQRVLNKYKELESRGVLYDHDCEGGKAATARLWKAEAARVG